MPRRQSPSLTDGELRLMRVLWRRGRATVGEVWQVLRGPRKPAYNSVQTLLRILESKGYVRHEKEGRAFVYVPVVAQREATQEAVRHMIGQFFDGKAGLLALDLLEDGDLEADELARLEELIARHTRR